MTESSDVQAAVDSLAAALGQSVLVEDTAKQPLWWSAQGAVDGTRLSSILERRADPKAVAVINRLKLAKAPAPVRTPAVPEADMWARWCMPIRYEGRHLGFVWVLDRDGTVREEDLPLLVDCAELAAETMARMQETAENVQHIRAELLDRLLRGPDEEAARDLARLEHLPHDARVQVAAPRGTGGWSLPDDMSAHVTGSRPRIMTSGVPLPCFGWVRRRDEPAPPAAPSRPERILPRSPGTRSVRGGWSSRLPSSSPSPPYTPAPRYSRPSPAPTS